MLEKLKKFVKDNFIFGLISVGPIFGTIYILYLLFSFLDRIFGQIYQNIFGFPVPGAGLITLFVFVILTGAVARTYIVNNLISTFERSITKIPVAGMVYSAFKSLVDMAQKSKSELGKPVMVDIGGMYIPGFEVISDGKTSNILLASSFAGFIFVVPKEKVINLPGWKPDDMLKFILSLGSYHISDVSRILERFRPEAKSLPEIQSKTQVEQVQEKK
jgi:uncharacterized membrane protein